MLILNKDTDFLARLDWRSHNGINLFMLNDIQRNRFYDMVLADKVKDKVCVDIGFGTGLLSVIALKHGAKKIVAYESNHDRYFLGQHIIKELNLVDKIDLYQDNFLSSDVTNEDTVYFTETMCQNLWGERLFNSLPRKKGINFLPNNLFLEIHAVEISNSYMNKLYDFKDLDGFEPSIDIQRDFVKLINSLGFSNFNLEEKNLANGIIEFNYQASYFGHNSYLNLSNQSTLVAEYNVDVNNLELIINDSSNSFTQEINFEIDEVDLFISDSTWNEKNILIIPRVGIKSDNQKLYLDRGHWGPMNKPVILNNCYDVVKVTHSLKTGQLNYYVEQGKI